MQKIVNILQIAIGALLVAAILLQARGTGLSTIFGGSGEIYRTKRGLEKIIFILTIVLAIIFFALGIVNLLLAK